MQEIKVGQVWRDKDKRRNTVIEILSHDVHKNEVVGLVVGTEEERTYKVERLVSRWELTREAPEIVDAAVKLIEEVKKIQVPTAKKRKVPKAPKYKTREEWLHAAIDLIRERIFTPVEVTVPDTYVSIGWTKGRSRHRGECFAAPGNGKKAHVFINPDIDTTEQILLTLTHELIHVWDENKSDHKGAFAKVGRQIGLLPPMTTSVADETLAATLKEILGVLGPIPHERIPQVEKPVTQKTYMKKIVCQWDDEFKLRMTKKMIEDYGYPSCPCHHKPMVLADGEEL